MAMNVQHDTRGHHETQMIEYVCNFPQSVLIFDSNCKLENISTQIGWYWINFERDFHKIEGFVQIQREVIEC